jgi:hypothetical protein
VTTRRNVTVDGLWRGWVEADEPPIDPNGFVRDPQRACKTCEYKQVGERMRRMKMCGTCKRPRRRFDGTWSSDISSPAGTREVGR